MRLLSNFALILALFAAGTADAAAPVAGKMVFNRSSSAEPDTLDPHVTGGNTAAVVLADLFEGLLTMGPRAEIIPGLAESHSISPDGLIYTFNLRPNLKWSDGTALTAEDFVYSFRRAQKPETTARYAQWVWAIKNAQAINQGKMPADSLGIAAPDARTVQITLEAPSPTFLEMVASFISYPVPRHVIDKFGPAWITPENMVSNGAYVLKERIPQTRITAVKNPHYYGAATVKIDEVNYFPTDSLGTTLNRFRAGELDAALNFPPEQIEWIRQNLPQELHVAPTLGAFYFLVNVRKPELADVRVRKALSMAIDRDNMIQKVLATGVKATYGLVSPEVDGYKSYVSPFAATPMPARIAEAKKLLADAGYGPGKPLKITLRYDTLEDNRKIGVFVSAMWKAIGVETEQINSEFRDVQLRARSGDFDVIRWVYFPPLSDASGYLSLFRGGDISNYSGFANAEFDRLLAESNITIDPAKRAALLEGAEKVLLDEYAALPIYHYAARRLIKTTVKGWQDNARNTNLTRYLSVERPASP